MTFQVKMTMEETPPRSNVDMCLGWRKVNIHQADVIKALALDIAMTESERRIPTSHLRYQELTISSNLGMLLARKWRMLHVRD